MAEGEALEEGGGGETFDQLTVLAVLLSPLTMATCGYMVFTSWNMVCCSSSCTSGAHKPTTNFHSSPSPAYSSLNNSLEVYALAEFEGRAQLPYFQWLHGLYVSWRFKKRCAQGIHNQCWIGCLHVTKALPEKESCAGSSFWSPLGREVAMLNMAGIITL